MRWFYDTASKLYRSEFGDVVSQDTLKEVRDTYLSESESLIDDYAILLDDGTWTIPKFETEMRSKLKNAYISEYVLGRGGVSQMTQSDWGRIGNMLRNQYGYLRSYLDDLESGKETRGTATNRARNFLGSARQSFSRGRGRAWDLDLPAHPGDGGTPCHGNCRCHWEIEEDEEEFRAYWNVGGSKPCAGCIARAANWSPFVVVKEAA